MGKLDVNFSFRNTKEPSKVDQMYPDTPVLAFVGKEGAKTAKSFQLNKCAFELLGYDPEQNTGRIAHARIGQTKTLLLVNVSTIEEFDKASNIHKNESKFSDGDLLKKINAYYEIDLQSDDVLELSIPEGESELPVLEIVGLVKEESATEEVQEVVAEEGNTMPDPNLQGVQDSEEETQSQF